MIDRSRYVSWTYQQPGQQCVLAAYGAAMWPSTAQHAHEYFDAYCRHFALNTAGMTAEAAYDHDFHRRAEFTPGGGFGVIHCLHQTSNEPAFSKARAAGTLTFVADGASAWPRIELLLRSTVEATAQIFVNDNPGSPFNRMHSVCLAVDSTGLYGYDSAVARIVALPAGKAQLGLLGHTFLFQP